MQTFTAKQLHDNPSEVYRAAVKGPVKISHKHHGYFYIVTYDHVERELDGQAVLGTRDIIGE